MAKVLGYGGLAATNGARDFSGKTEAEEVPALVSTLAISLHIGISILLALIWRI